MGSDMFRYRIAIFSKGSRVYVYGAQYEQDAIDLAKDMLLINTGRDKAVVEKWDAKGFNCLETVLTLEAVCKERVVNHIR